MCVVIFLLLFTGCFGRDDVKVLDGVEVRQYKGKDLSSVNDFRENSIKGPQYVNQSTYILEVDGLLKEPKRYSYDDVLGGFQSYSKVVTLNCVEGWSVTILWEGVLVGEILKASNPSAEANTVIFYAVDGYSTSFPLDYIMDNPILMAYKMNNVTLPLERGFPFQLVAEDKWGYKWIKWIDRIKLTDDPDYKGFWEKRGYSKTGNLNESKFN